MRLEKTVTEEEAFETNLINFITMCGRIKPDKIMKLIHSLAYKHMKEYLDENELFSSISAEAIRIKSTIASLSISLLGVEKTEEFYDIRKGDWFIRDITHDDTLYQEISVITNIRVVSGTPTIVSSRVVIEAISIAIPSGSNHHLSEVHPICFNTSMVNMFYPIDNVCKYTRLGIRFLGVVGRSGCSWYMVDVSGQTCI